MLFKEQVAALEALPAESRWWFAAYHVERQFREAELHPIPRTQLRYIPSLEVARRALWARAESGVDPQPSDLEAILRSADDFDQEDPSTEDMLQVFDPLLTRISLSARKAVRLFTEPQSNTGRFVAGFSDLAFQCVSIVYTDVARAQRGETAVADASIELLQRVPASDLTRRLFDEIPNWERGAVEPHYARGLYDPTEETYS